MHGRIPGLHPHLLGLAGKPLGPHMQSTPMPPEGRTVCKHQKMQVQHRHHGVRGIHPVTKWTTDGPFQDISNHGVARTVEGEGCASISRIHKFLSEIHSWVCRTYTTTNKVMQEKHPVFWEGGGQGL